MCLAAPIVTGKGHCKIEPKAKHFSHGKINKSSWPNQTNKSKKKYKAIVIMHKRVQIKLK